MEIARSIEPQIEIDLHKKMVFLSGPRQCGKTTLAKKILEQHTGHYYNWDKTSDKKLILKEQFSLDSKLWVFDETHKFRRWRNFLKGVFDEHHKNHSIFVTGSARLNLYGRGGDSLQGRYFPHHLHPFTLSEISKVEFYGLDTCFHLPHQVKKETQANLLHLYQFSGFPEPFFSGNITEAKRWKLAYGERLIEEDLRSLENVREIDRLELLLDRLDDIAGSVVSINSLREDLDVSFDSVKNWLTIFEKIFACFRISPYAPPKIKAVKKEQKLYLWDSTRPTEEGARFENFIALHLMRLIDWGRDVLGEKLELRYFRHREGAEVDFILLRNRVPWVAIEVKIQEQEISPSLKYFVERVKTPFAFQVFLKGGKEKTLARVGKTNIQSISAERFLLQLP